MEDLTDRQRIAGNVRAEMARHRVSREAVAVHLGLHSNSVNSRLTAKIGFRAEEIVQLADLFGVTPDTLIGVAA